MPEYIEREVLIENLNKFAPEQYNALVDMIIRKQPVADVVEVKHGEWKDNGDRDSNGVAMPFAISCSVCGSSAGTSWMNYCPSCGAKMDLKEGEGRCLKEPNK